jgi:hypothetical protein
MNTKFIFTVTISKFKEDRLIEKQTYGLQSKLYSVLVDLVLANCNWGPESIRRYTDANITETGDT